MIRRTIATAALGLLFSLSTACATTPAARPVEPPDRPQGARGTLRVVGVLPQRLNPPHLIVGSEERVAWLNYTDRAIQIELDPAALPSLRCANPDAFELDGTRLRVRENQSGFVDSGCRLTPGEYGYRVERAARDGEAPEVIYGSLVVVPQAALVR